MRICFWFILICGTCLSPICSQSGSNNDSRLKKEIEDLIKFSSADSLSIQDKKAYLQNAFDYIRQLDDDSLRLKLLSNLSYYILPEERDFFRQVNSATLQLSFKIKDSTSLANAYWDLGYFYAKNSEKDSSYYSYYNAQKIFEEQGNMYHSARMLYNMGKQQQEIRDYIGSEANLVAAIARLKPLNKYRELYNCYNTLAIISQALEEYDEAINYYNEARFYLKKMENTDIEIWENNHNRGVVSLDKGNYKNSKNIFDGLLTTENLLIQSPNLYAKTLNNLALTKIKLGDTLGSAELIKTSIKKLDSLGDSRSLASAYSTLSQYSLYAKDTLKAIVNAKTALEKALESSSNERALDTYALLTRIDHDNASDYAQKYITLSDSLQREERQARNKFARIRFETDEFIAQNEQLEEETALLARQKQIWTGVALGFFLLGISVYIIINQRAKNQKLLFAQQQQANNQEIFNLMLTQKQKVDEVKRLEQKRISEELHDGVLGKMLGARMVLTGLNKRTGPEAIEARLEAINALKNVEQEVRSISHELSHSAYQKINNFINSVEDLLGTVKESSQIITIFNYDEDEDYDALKGEIKINLYRMIQEGLQNAIKHSDGKTFFVKFERNGNILNVEMGDDGKGFDLEKEKRGIGMRNISSRVEKLNGTWKVLSEPMKGTTITLEIPLQHVDSNSQAALQKV